MTRHQTVTALTALSTYADDLADRRGNGGWYWAHYDDGTRRHATLAELLATEDEATVMLLATDTADLLTKAYALTHQIDRAKRLSETPGYPDRAGCRALLADLRAARDLITAEVLRRTDGR